MGFFFYCRCAVGSRGTGGGQIFRTSAVTAITWPSSVPLHRCDGRLGSGTAASLHPLSYRLWSMQHTLSHSKRPVPSDHTLSLPHSLTYSRKTFPRSYISPLSAARCPLHLSKYVFCDCFAASNETRRFSIVESFFPRLDIVPFTLLQSS